MKPSWSLIQIWEVAMLYTKEIAKMFHEHHEYFWDIHHLNVRVNEQSKNLSLELHHVIVKHDKNQIRIILDTAESMIEDE